MKDKKMILLSQAVLRLRFPLDHSMLQEVLTFRNNLFPS